MNLRGMREKPVSLLHPWERPWTAFGPVPGQSFSFMIDHPGADALKHIPAVLKVDGKVYPPVACRSQNGFLNFHDLFRSPHKAELNDWRGLCAFLFTELYAARPVQLPISFGADWTTRWWVNGREIYNTRTGNGISPEDIYSNQFLLPLQRGRNVILIKVGNGLGGWNIRLYTAAGGQPTVRRARRLTRAIIGRPTRDYAFSGLRLENRNENTVPGRSRWALEAVARNAGVESRWIQVVDSRTGHTLLGSPFFRSRFLTPSPAVDHSSAQRLKSWIAAIHRHGMPAISWYPMSFSTEAVLKHADWASRPMPGKEHERQELGHGCINSPYGEALIKFAIEAIEQFGLDGFWFDGGFFVPGSWVGCACRHCRRKFRAQTGRPFPRRVAWSDPDFQRWVRWRYDSFAEFWGRLAGRIRRAHPHAQVVINHLHRVGSSWLNGCPLNPMRIDMIGGSEASSLNFTSAFTTRLMRAYEYRQVEVWMGLHGLNDAYHGDPSVYLHHALACLTAGGLPSFGTDETADCNAAAYRAFSAIINPRRPWTGGPSVPYVALHVSQQAETFFFSRLKSHYPDGYWQSVLGWNNLLTETQCLTDVIFDDHLTAMGLSRYPAVVLPLSAALSSAQLAALEEYVRGGGILVTGPWFGAGAEWGEAADPGRVISLLGVRAASLPDPANYRADGTGVTVRACGQGFVVRLTGDVGRHFHCQPCRTLALEIARLLHSLAPSPIVMKPDPDIHVGLFRQPGELILHVCNGVGYSTPPHNFPHPITQPPVRRRNVRIEVRGFPIRAVKTAVSEGGSSLKYHSAGMTTTLVIPALEWGAVCRLLL